MTLGFAFFLGRFLIGALGIAACTVIARLGDLLCALLDRCGFCRICAFRYAARTRCACVARHCEQGNQ
jgi:hypothetical protein